MHESLHESFTLPNLSANDQAIIHGQENRPILTPEKNIGTICEEISQLPNYFDEQISRIQDSERKSSMKHFLIEANKLKELANAYIAYTRRYSRQENAVINPETFRRPAISVSDIQDRYTELKQYFENALANINQEGQSSNND